MSSDSKTCSDCSQPLGTISLQCKLHLICGTCLIQRGKDQPENVLRCEECDENKALTQHTSYRDILLKQTTPTDNDQSMVKEEETGNQETELPGIWIFVDDSNIWIEAKKLQSEKRRFKTEQDHRVRIDVGKLAEAIADGRPVQKGFLYGSEPPPVDTVWEKIRKIKNFSVHSKHRSQLTGKEKQVDTMLVADITEIAIKTPVHERTTTVLVTGDADAIPGLEKVLKEERWKIEVYMWKKAIASTLYRFASDHRDRVEIKELDNYMDRVTFTSMKFNFSFPRDKFLLQKVKESGVVFAMVPGTFRHRVPTKAWCNQIESITQWPFQYYWFELSKEATDSLVIVFQHNEREKLDIKTFLDMIQDSKNGSNKCCLPNVEKVQTFLSFNEEILKKKDFSTSCRPIDMALEQVGTYNKEDVHESYDSVGPKRMKRYRLYSDPCRYKMNCAFGTKCQNQHTEDEKAYFRQQRDGRGNPMRKTTLCNNYSESKKCRRDARDCQYAHGEDDAWCLICISNGHFTNNCPEYEK